MKRKLISLVITFAMLASTLTCMAVVTPGLENFQQKNTYTEGQFYDVSGASWYAPTVRYAYELGLVKGTSDFTFTPDGNIKISESLALACRLHSIYHTGSADFVQGEPWYQVYVDYAEANRIIAPGQFANVTAFATRAEFAAILASALPDTALEAINYVSELPDVTWTMPYAEEIYMLYNAGVLTGSDDKGTFYPYNSIKRSEVATIVARMANSEMRQTLSFKEVAPTLSVSNTSLVIAQATDISVTVKSDSEFTAVWECESDVIDLTWGDFRDIDDTTSVASLTITPLKNGSASFRVYIEGYPENYITVYVTVQMAVKMDVYDYLKSVAIENGNYSDGTYMYPIFRDISEYDTSVVLVYDLDRQEVILWMEMEDYNSSTGSMLMLQSGLYKPYDFFLNMEFSIYDLSGLAYIYPSSFRGDTHITFHTKSDNSVGMQEIWYELGELGSSMLEVSLVVLEDEVLKPGGYSLDDLGFYNI